MIENLFRLFQKGLYPYWPYIRLRTLPVYHFQCIKAFAQDIQSSCQRVPKRALRQIKYAS